MIQIIQYNNDNNKQILIDYEGNGTNYHRRGDLGATIFPSRKAREDGSPEITEAMIVCIHCPSKGG